LEKYGIRKNVVRGARKGLKSFFWIIKIIVPVSLLAFLLEWSGATLWLEPVFKPLMSLINLPPEAFIPIIASIFADVYGGIAAMAVMNFSAAQMTLIMLFSAISHSLVIEGLIQARSGIGFFKITLIRLVASVVSVYLLSLVFSGTGASVGPPVTGTGTGFLEALWGWAQSIGLLTIQIFGLVMIIMIGQELALSSGLIEKSRKWLSPVMRMMGLSGNVLVAWLVAIFAGVTVGSAVIMEECRRGTVSRRELERLHTSIGINHSMVEQSVVMTALVGVNIFYIMFIRLIGAILFVRLLGVWQNLVNKIFRRFSPVQYPD
jgi:hypothetical protein